jgi:TM2 domain-containing membrane protein YozV
VAYPPVAYPPVSATPATGLPVPYPPPAAGYEQPAYGAAYGGQPHGASADAPFGIDPVSGRPLSDKSKLVAGLLQIFLGGFAVGRFYTGHIGLALAQLGVVWGIGFGLCCAGAILSVFGGFVIWFIMPIGTLWPLIDGIMLLTGGGTDAKGRVLRS